VTLALWLAFGLVAVGTWRRWRWLEFVMTWVAPPLIFLYFVADVYRGNWGGAAWNLGVLVFMVVTTMYPSALDAVLVPIVRPIARTWHRLTDRAVPR